LLRCYISRVENGHTVPGIKTIEKLARALEVPLYQLFYDGEEPPKLPNLPKRKTSDVIARGSSGKDARFMNQLRRQLGRMDKDDRLLLLFMAQRWRATEPVSRMEGTDVEYRGRFKFIDIWPQIGRWVRQ